MFHDFWVLNRYGEASVLEYPIKMKAWTEIATPSLEVLRKP